MDLKPDIHVDPSLIGRYLAGEALPEEAIAIDEWRAQHPANQAMFAELALLWQQASPGTPYRAQDLAQAWEQLKPGLEITTSRRVAPTLASRLKIAASIVMLLGVGLTAYLLLRPGAKERYTVLRSGENVIKDTLQDQSVVTLWHNSRLSVNRRFAQGKREVTLDGEAYFSVAPLAGQPFTIRMDNLEITVLGTAFNVRKDSNTITVSVNEGMVRMRAGSAQIQVSAGATGVYERVSGRLQLQAVIDRNSYAYATRTLYFYNMPMEEVKVALEKSYGISVVFENEKLARCRLNTQFDRQPLQQVLHVIAASLGLQYRFENNIVYFSGNECS
ncbi:FecR family protein [Chitinophaga terrae (ex Kim and Jung 2007)]|uniref:FecR family protein n=1 Tax=Chitinophaga terrae (ex Kim and Jung 2007) TaxID=408074 RepID=A0A1H3ZHA1_9BACT|nr:FecR domain-containing protein [Chitinophaga terrae (ex Kim and Jung 2007)]SEA23156.1 FecR family protein [Chitinophaga terrae (ex Kim and Jung 2007)]